MNWHALVLYLLPIDISCKNNATPCPHAAAAAAATRRTHLVHDGVRYAREVSHVPESGAVHRSGVVLAVRLQDAIDDARAQEQRVLERVRVTCSTVQEEEKEGTSVRRALPVHMDCFVKYGTGKANTLPTFYKQISGTPAGWSVDFRQLHFLHCTIFL